MKMKTRLLLLALSLIGVSAYAQKYTIGVYEKPCAASAARTAPSNLNGLWDKLTPYLSKTTGEQFTVKPYTSLAKLEEALRDGHIDFSYSQDCGSPAYILQHIPQAKLLATINTRDSKTNTSKPTFTLYLVTARKGLDIAQASDINKLNGKTLVMGSSVDPSWGRAYFTQKLHQFTVKNETKHLAGILDVLNGKADATLSPDRPLSRLTSEQMAELRVIPLFELTNGAMFVRTNAEPVAAKVQTALLHAPKDFFIGQHAQGFSTPLSKQQYMNGQ